VYEPDDEDEVAMFWREQAQLPWRRRDFLWWSEVALPNVVVSLVIIAVAAFLLIGLVSAISDMTT
jgi:hypothetical protein